MVRCRVGPVCDDPRRYVVMVIPYYEWRELKSLDDKLLYLYSLGRKVYKRIKEKDELSRREAAKGTVVSFNTGALRKYKWW